MGMYSPLEQFKIFVIFPISFWKIDLTITNATVYTVITGCTLYCLFVLSVGNMRMIPNIVQGLTEDMFIFVHDVVKQQAGLRGIIYIPAMLVVFYIILWLNSLGLLPYSFTCTSQVCYTFTIGFGMFIGIVSIGLLKQRSKFVKQFVPETTGPLLPLLVVIEIFSYCIRPFSLSIRLFANMLAGHTLMYILGTFAISLYNIDILLGILMGMPIIAVSVLEAGIAALQAYVFLVLLSIYMKDSLYGHG